MHAVLSRHGKAEIMYRSEHDYILACDAFMRAYPDFRVTDDYSEGLKSAP